MNELLRAILGGTYTSAQLGDFVQKCYALALPAIRKKIALGKINRDIIRLSERDMVYDCIADLFARTPDRKFSQLIAYFSDHLTENETPSDEKLTILLRCLVLGNVNQGVIRLYLEADPVLGKILRNLKLGLERTQLFDKEDRFGEMHIFPKGLDRRMSAPPIPAEILRRRFLESVLVHNTVPEMLTKLHAILKDEDTYQRTATMICVALLIKEVYSVDVPDSQFQIVDAEHTGEDEDVAGMASKVCRWLDRDKRSSYVEKEKLTDETFDGYLRTIHDILWAHFGDGNAEELSYFETLQKALPCVTRNGYDQRHRTTLEYLARLAKQRMKIELKK